jgi:hypothetical protein
MRSSLNFEKKLLLLGQEIRPTDVVDDRIDLLAIDPNGATVIIELKRDSHKLQLLQALAYAGMIAQWSADRLMSCRSETMSHSLEMVEDEFHQFLLEDAERLNEAKRIILIAEEYDYEVLIAAEWLHEKYQVDVRCYRLALSADGPNEYLSCMCVFPPKELADHANGRRRVPMLPAKWADRDAALSQIGNPAVMAFYKAELARGRDSYLCKRIFRYKMDGRRRWSMAARKDSAYVWQNGRFADDEAFWKERFGEVAEVTPVKRGTCLSFKLSTVEHFDRFLKAFTSEVKNDDFLGSNGESDEGDEPPV